MEFHVKYRHSSLENRLSLNKVFFESLAHVESVNIWLRFILWTRDRGIAVVYLNYFACVNAYTKKNHVVHDIDIIWKLRVKQFKLHNL